MGPMSDEVQVTPLIHEEDLAQRVAEMGADIAKQCEGVDEVVIIGLLRGTFVFMADLTRAMSRQGVKQILDFVGVQSYGSGTTSSGNPRLSHELERDIEGRTVLLVDDILDTGRTLKLAVEYLRDKGADRLITAVLLDKPSRRAVEITADHVGFEVPDRFVVGYGTDFDGRFRELPYVGYLSPEPKVV
jgi:hypoxanthine phosphoribosyltransferase